MVNLIFSIKNSENTIIDITQAHSFSPSVTINACKAASSIAYPLTRDYI